MAIYVHPMSLFERRENKPFRTQLFGAWELNAETIQDSTIWGWRSEWQYFSTQLLWAGKGNDKTSVSYSNRDLCLSQLYFSQLCWCQILRFIYFKREYLKSISYGFQATCFQDTSKVCIFFLNLFIKQRE